MNECGQPVKKVKPQVEHTPIQIVIIIMMVWSWDDNNDEKSSTR